MKKLSLILAGALLFGSISFASPVVKQQPAASTSKQAAKPAAKKETKKTNAVKKGAPVKKAANLPAK